MLVFALRMVPDFPHYQYKWVKFLFQITKGYTRPDIHTQKSIDHNVPSYIVSLILLFLLQMVIIEIIKGFNKTQVVGVCARQPTN